MSLGQIALPINEINVTGQKDLEHRDRISAQRSFWIQMSDHDSTIFFGRIGDDFQIPFCAGSPHIKIHGPAVKGAVVYVDQNDGIRLETFEF